MYIAFVLMVVSIIFLYGFAQYKYNNQKISHINIHFDESTNRFLTNEMVNKLLIQNNANPLNHENTSLNLHLIECSVQSNEMVENAEVFIEPQGHLNINIKERLPIVRIKTAIKSYYLDDRGLAMPLSPIYSERVPIAVGIYSREMEIELFELVDKFRSDYVLSKQIIGIERLENGDFLLTTRIGNYKILFGNTERIEEKIKNLKIFYKKMWNDEKLNTYTLINLKFKNQVIGSY